MKSTLVSIITPMHNAEAYVAETIESVLAQSWPNWELIIVDDGSTDSCPEIVQRYAAQDDRICYHRQSRGGVAAARNTAISLAQGRYLAFLDSDDTWKPEKLAMQIRYMKQTGAAFCYSSCDVMDENSRLTGKVRWIPEQVSYDKLLRGNVIPCLTVIIDRWQVPEVKIPAIHHEDYAAWLDILETGIVAHGIRKVLASYRKGKKSLSANKWKALGWTWRIYREYLGLGVLKSSWCFMGYVWNAVRKRM